MLNLPENSVLHIAVADGIWTSSELSVDRRMTRARGHGESEALLFVHVSMHLKTQRSGRIKAWRNMAETWMNVRAMQGWEKIHLGPQGSLFHPLWRPSVHLEMIYSTLALYFASVLHTASSCSNTFPLKDIMWHQINLNILHNWHSVNFLLGINDIQCFFNDSLICSTASTITWYHI